MIRKTLRVTLVVLALLTLALGMPAWTFGGDSPVRLFNSFGPSFGSRGGATFLFGFGHPHVFPHRHHQGFLVLGLTAGQFAWG